MAVAVAHQEPLQRFHIQDLAGDVPVADADFDGTPEHGAAGFPVGDPVGILEGEMAFELFEQREDDAEAVKECAGGLKEGDGAAVDIRREVPGMRGLRDVDADAYNQGVWSTGFQENARKFAVPGDKIVGPFDFDPGHGRRKPAPSVGGVGETGEERKTIKRIGRHITCYNNRHEDRLIGLGGPGVAQPAPAGGLVIGQDDGAVGSACRRVLPGDVIGGGWRPGQWRDDRVSMIFLCGRGD